MKPPLHVLFVEDSLDDVVLMLRELERSYQVTAERVETRESLTAALAAGSWDVILCDFQMPKFDAVAALQTLRDLRSDLPCIIVSGTVGEETAVQAIKAGAHDYLLKDRLARLGPAVERAIRDSGSRRALRMAERERRRMERVLAEAQRLAHVGSWEWDPVAGTMVWSDEMFRIHGLEPRRPALIPYDAFLAQIHPDDRERVRETIDAIRREGEPLECEHRVVRADGEERVVQFRGTLDSGARVIGSSQDITHRKTAEQALERSEAQLRQSQKMEGIGQLAGGIAHDFNNLLTAILGYTELLLAELPDGPHRRDLEEIRKAADNAAALTRQLLAFSRKQILQPRVLDLNAVVSETQKLLRRVIGEMIELTTDLDPALGTIEADEGQLVQVVVNLAVNARDAMPDGGRLVIRTANADVSAAAAAGYPGLAPGSYVLLSVADTGMGMTPEVRARLFEPFFTTKEQGKGTGLGLSTVYGIVKQSDGHIAVDSEPGAGSTFTIFLPRRLADATAAPRRTAGAGRAAGHETILLVEDETGLRRLASRVLERQGYRVLLAGDGAEALGVCRAHLDPIHLIVTDLVMPEMGGRELAEWLAEMRPGIRVLFMSGYTDDPLARHGLADMGAAFLPKPFTPEALVRKIREVLDSQTPAGGVS